LGEMSEEKRARLKRALLKRGYGGPPFQIPIRMIDAETERELASLPGVESTRAFIQERYGVEIDGEAPPVRRREALSIGVPATHAYYGKRIIAGRWFE